ncbi:MULTISPECIES: hypothetical protein [Rhizobium]|uniref:Uncharacterized protein n=1 Tax=Rhizobium leguminosarum bv. viciae TaxID=387 RepID=A0A8G2ITW3_RHILV|nr:hypothetical protein [Rhizobium leguminosarum]NKK11585.1 hypothetical protein [Rhizobium leguminosarum bv. viciae]NKK25568.1 hypothetical protein [Rhizobium leguminosarum bv. viciae]TBX84881.1 hypothetical protein E0H31_36140 [Rhizobium leguminosarum bv. viciae]TBZ07807.1 hypothetical protein E0H52_36745 [Rhizobium leguminosarum bv. viciae]
MRDFAPPTGNQMREIEDAIRAGERNRDMMVLVRNYCANARIEKFGGTGMIERETGLPIGHHGMRCDFAPEGGMASWDLRDAAIDFYDRNCAGCAHRKPLRLPNLLKIIADRDRKQATREAQAEADSRAAAKALAERDSTRAALMPKLGAVARTLLEDIGVFDADRSSENCERVTQSARLAPEHFSPDLVQYVFALGTNHPWFAETALIILDAVGAENKMVVELAVDILKRGYPASVAVQGLFPRLETLSAAAVAGILAAAIDLADPGELDFFYGSEDSRPRDSRLLEGLWQCFRAEVVVTVEQMLLSGRRSDLQRAGRALHVLHAVDRTATTSILRTLASVYVRAPSLVSDLEDDEDRLPDLADALNDAFDVAPQEVDNLLQSLQQGAPASHRARIVKVYALAVQVGYDDPPVSASSLRHTLALKRLVWAPTVERDDKVIEEVASAFRSGSKGLENVVRAQLDAFTGALFLLDDRLAQLEAAINEPAENVFVAMERNTRRMVVRGLMEQLVDWASEAATDDSPSVAKIIGLFDTIPEGRDNLRGILLGATKELSRDLDGLKQLLPHLYAALVGSSVLGRSCAATAIGELPYHSITNIPDLLFEAFGALLRDQYVMVHKTAVAAFQRSIVPERYRINAANAILSLIHYYRTQSKEDAFLAECVSLLAGMADLFGNQSGLVRRYLIDVAMDIDPIFLRSCILSLSHSLGHEAEFAKLAARMIPQMADRYNQSDTASKLLRKVTKEGLASYAGAFHDAAVAVLDIELHTALGIVEAFLLAGMVGEAESLITALVDSTGDNVRFRRRRRMLQWPRLAMQFEAAVSARDLDRMAATSRAWMEAAVADAQDQEDGRERSARSSLPF